MPRITFGALVNWMFEYSMISSRLPHGSRKSRKRTFDKARAGGFRQFDDAAAVVDDKAQMPLLDAVDRVVGHQGHVDELVAHVDERVALALAAQREIEDTPVPRQRLIDVADLDRDMIDADEPRFPLLRS